MKGETVVVPLDTLNTLLGLQSKMAADMARIKEKVLGPEMGAPVEDALEAAAAQATRTRDFRKFSREVGAMIRDGRLSA